MLQNFQDLVFSNATLTPTSGAASAFRNKSQSVNPLIVFVVTITSAPTGTSPTLSFQLGGSVDGVNFALIGSTGSMSAAGTYRYAFSGVLEPYLNVTPVVSSGASFSGVTVIVLSTSPDS